jgi:hypothetical protein
MSISKSNFFSQNHYLKLMRCLQDSCLYNVAMQQLTFMFLNLEFPD